MLTMLLASSVVLGLLAQLLLAQLWPALRRGRPATLYVGIWAVCIGGWLALRGLDGAALTVARALIGTWLASCLAVLFFGLPVLLLSKLARLRHLRRPLTDGLLVDPGRRQLLAGLALPAVAASTGAVGTAAGLGGFVVRREEVRIEGLPAGLDGFKIGQLTDTHIGEFIEVAYLARAVEALDAEAVDLTVMTGDLIDDLAQLEPTLAALERCRAPLGLLAILGNHEKIRGRLPPILEAYRGREKRGTVRLLVDAHVGLSHRGARLRVVGVDYPMAPGGRPAVGRGARLERMRVSAERAFAGVPAGETVLCLSHHPDFFPLAAERGARLTLSGHTHGGQVALLGRPLFSAFEYMLGRYRRGPAHLYVSGGTGHWLPFRVGVPPEVTVLTLRAA